MSRILVLFGIVLATGSAAAQGSIPPLTEPPVAPSGSTVQGQETEGTITAVDPQTRTITLDDGETYVVLDAANPVWDRLREGTSVRLRYDVDAGRNAATAVTIAR
ncbi:MAG: DUF1344 domain-containing protein [Candidatus Rokuibacteriota bacterium]